MRYHELFRRLLGLLLVAAACLVTLSPRVESEQIGTVYVSEAHVVESTEAAEAADVPVTKSEAVYVNLAPDGAVQSVSVTDHLHSDQPQVRIEDASDLTQIQDVKTNLYPVLGTDRIYWDLDGTDLYYSGKSFNDPPVQFSVNYTLDGSAVTAEELAGKSGHVTMEIAVQNTLRKDLGGWSVTCPILLVGGMILPDDGFSNVEVTSGAVVGDGIHRIVVMVGVPGMDESLGVSSLGIPLLGETLGTDSYTVSADVENFALGNMMFAAVPFSSLDALTSGDLSSGLDGVKQVFADIESVMSAFSGMRMQEIMDMLYGDMEQAENLIAAATDAAVLYQENAVLLQTLSPYMTDENINQLKKLLTDMEQIDMVRLKALLDNQLFQQLVDLISLIDQEARDLVTVAEDAVALTPTMDAIRADLQTPEAQAALDRLPETAERLRVLLEVLDENRGIFDDLSVLQETDVAGGVQTILNVAQKYTQLDVLNNAQQQNLAGRMREWLSFGEEYDIFTQRTDRMTSSVSFIYKVASIG